MKKNDKFQQYKLSNYINEEDIVDLAYEFDLSEYNVSKKLKKNIKEKTLNELNLKPRLRPKAVFKVSIASLLAIMCLFIATTPSAMAAFKSVIRYIPGFSTLLQDDPSTTERYVLEQPVEKVFGSKKAIITGLTADNKSASFYLTFYDNAFRLDDYEQVKVSVDKARENFINSITIKDAMGNKLKKSTSSWALGGGEFMGRFTYTGDIKNPQSLQISFENDEKSSINLKLTKAKDYNSYTELGPSDNKNGVSIMAVAKNINDNINVKLFTPLDSTYSVRDYGIGLISASDDAGNNYEISTDRINSLHCRNEFNIASKNLNAKSLTVTIPQILLRYDKPTQETKIEVDIPEKSSMDLNKKIIIQGHTIFLKKVEKLENNRIRLYWGMNISDKDNEYITGFSLGDIYSSKSLYDYTSINALPYPVIQATDLSYNPGEKTIAANVSYLEIAKRGPWKIKIDK